MKCGAGLHGRGPLPALACGPCGWPLACLGFRSLFRSFSHGIVAIAEKAVNLAGRLKMEWPALAWAPFPGDPVVSGRKGGMRTAAGSCRRFLPTLSPPGTAFSPAGDAAIACGNEAPAVSGGVPLMMHIDQANKFSMRGKSAQRPRHCREGERPSRPSPESCTRKTTLGGSAPVGPAALRRKHGVHDLFDAAGEQPHPAQPQRHRGHGEHVRLERQLHQGVQALEDIAG